MLKNDYKDTILPTAVFHMGNVFSVALHSKIINIHKVSNTTYMLMNVSLTNFASIQSSGNISMYEHAYCSHEYSDLKNEVKRFTFLHISLTKPHLSCVHTMLLNSP